MAKQNRTKPVYILASLLAVAVSLLSPIIPICENLSIAAPLKLMGTVPVVFPLMAPRLSSSFGTRKHPVHHMVRHHSGVDLAAPKYSHVRAVLDGKVVFADSHGGYGKLVTIEHAEGFVSLYGHLDEITVNPGQRIKAGELLGRVGSTGLATGPHLHFEWRKNGKPIDPFRVLPALTQPASG